MNPNDVLTETKKIVKNSSCVEDTLSEIIDFFFNSYVEGHSKEDDGDMLLFQYGGPYPWDENTNINITRQFSFTDKEGEHKGMSQLKVNFGYDNEKYPMTNGNFWHEDETLEQFKEKVLNSEVVKSVWQVKPLNIRVKMQSV